MKIKVIGIYPVEEAPEPCHLVEIVIEDFQGNLDMGEFTQEVPGQPRDNWQVPWDEYVLSSDGTAGEPAPFPGPLKIDGSQRLAFFFHYLDASRPLLTPTGSVPLPEATRRPERLHFVKYEVPD